MNGLSQHYMFFCLVPFFFLIFLNQCFISFDFKGNSHVTDSRAHWTYATMMMDRAKFSETAIPICAIS